MRLVGDVGNYQGSCRVKLRGAFCSVFRLRVQRDDERSSPWASLARPPLGMELLRTCIDSSARSEDLDVVPCVAVSRSDESDAAVLMLVVVVLDEASHPRPSVIDGREAGDRVLGPVLERAKQRFDERIVVGDARSTKGRHDAETLQRREHRGSLHRSAVVGVQDPAGKVLVGMLTTDALDERGGELAGLDLVHFQPRILRLHTSSTM